MNTVCKVAGMAIFCLLVIVALAALHNEFEFHDTGQIGAHLGTAFDAVPSAPLIMISVFDVGPARPWERSGNTRKIGFDVDEQSYNLTAEFVAMFRGDAVHAWA